MRDDDVDELEAVHQDQDFDDLEEDESNEEGEGLDDLDDEEDDVQSSDGGGESGQASLEQLIAQRTARRSVDDFDETSEIPVFRREHESSNASRAPKKVAPIRVRQEFVCKRCHLVKPKLQLADEARRLCRDCA